MGDVLGLLQGGWRPIALMNATSRTGMYVTSHFLNTGEFCGCLSCCQSREACDCDRDWDRGRPRDTHVEDVEGKV